MLRRTCFRFKRVIKSGGNPRHPTGGQYLDQPITEPYGSLQQHGCWRSALNRFQGLCESHLARSGSVALVTTIKLVTHTRIYRLFVCTRQSRESDTGLVSDICDICDNVRLDSRIIRANLHHRTHIMARQFFVGGNYKLNPSTREQKAALVDVLNTAELDPATGTIHLPQF